MLGRFLKNPVRTGDAPAARVPEGLRLYAIGDIHGRSDLLDRMAALISDDLRRAPPQDAITVFLGDYIDRGLDSRGVIDRLVARDFPTPIVTLRGNHEETMLNFLDDERVLDSWRHYGGLEALHSYGVNVSEAMRGTGFARIRADFAARLPESHRAFLEQTKLSVAYGDYFFCHAGVRPETPLDRQDAQDLLWIRDTFLDYRGAYPKIIVHGHTPALQPELLPNRINIDTGAYMTGVLTALRLEEARKSFISTG